MTRSNRTFVNITATDGSGDFVAAGFDTPAEARKFVRDELSGPFWVGRSTLKLESWEGEETRVMVTAL